MDRVDPKFLIQINSDGVSKVLHSFELDTVCDGSVLSSGPEVHLPPLLLDAQHAKEIEKSHFTNNVVAGALKSLGLPIATGTCCFYRKQSKYLEKSLPPPGLLSHRDSQQNTSSLRSIS